VQIDGCGDGLLGLIAKFALDPAIKAGQDIPGSPVAMAGVPVGLIRTC